MPGQYIPSQAGLLHLASGCSFAFNFWLRFGYFKRTWSSLSFFLSMVAAMVCISLFHVLQIEHAIYLAEREVKPICWIRLGNWLSVLNEMEFPKEELHKIPSNSEKTSSLWEHHDPVWPVTMPVLNVVLFLVMAELPSSAGKQILLSLPAKFLMPILEKSWAWYLSLQSVYYHKMPQCHVLVAGCRLCTATGHARGMVY